MFGNSKKDNKNNKAFRPSANGSTSINTFGVGTIIEGEIKSEGDIRIDGKIIGVIYSKAKIVVGPEGVIEGDIFCQNADVQGYIRGKLEIKDLLFLKSTAKIDGDIFTSKLVVEKGAQFNGQCSMGAKKANYAEPLEAKPKAKATLQKEAVG